MVKSVITGAILALWMGIPALSAGDIPLLKDNPSSEHYTLVRVDDYWLPAGITYSPVGKFFVLDSLQISKFDALGNKVFSLKHSEGIGLLPFSYYIATPKGLYDLSKPRPKLERFVQVVNGDKTRTLATQSFDEIYAQAYAEADIVIYGQPNYEEGIDKYRAYMWITGDWVLFYLSDRAITLDADYDMGITVKEYPVKFSRTVLLKDVLSGAWQAKDAAVSQRTGERDVSRRSRGFHRHDRPPAAHWRRGSVFP